MLSPVVGEQVCGIQTFDLLLVISILLKEG